MGFEQWTCSVFDGRDEIAHEMRADEPATRTKMIITSLGRARAGGVGISKDCPPSPPYLSTCPRSGSPQYTATYPNISLFFTCDCQRSALARLLARLKERSENRDRGITILAMGQAAVECAAYWGSKRPAEPFRVISRAVANGDSTTHVPALVHPRHLAAPSPEQRLIILADFRTLGLCSAIPADFFAQAARIPCTPANTVNHGQANMKGSSSNGIAEPSTSRFADAPRPVPRADEFSFRSTPLA